MARSRKAGVMSQTLSSDGPRSRSSMEINDNAPWMNPSEVNGGGMGTGEKMARHKQKRSTNSCAKEMNQAHPLAATICFQVVTTVMTATRALKVESDRVNSNQRRSNTRHFTMPPLASAGWSREIPATGPTKFPRNSRDRRACVSNAVAARACTEPSCLASSKQHTAFQEQHPTNVRTAGNSKRCRITHDAHAMWNLASRQSSPGISLVPRRSRANPALIPQTSPHQSRESRESRARSRAQSREIFPRKRRIAKSAPVPRPIPRPFPRC